jgi:hypothetical protein
MVELCVVLHGKELRVEKRADATTTLPSLDVTWIQGILRSHAGVVSSLWVTVLVCDVVGGIFGQRRVRPCPACEP